MRISDWSSDVCSSDLCSLSETTTVAENRLYLSPSRGPDQTTLSFNTYALTVPFSPIRLTSIQFPETSAVIAVLIVVIDLTPSNSANVLRSEEHTSELQSLMRTSYAVFCLKKKTKKKKTKKQYQY